MPLDLQLRDFNKLAFQALKDRTVDFKNSLVERRLATCFAGRDIQVGPRASLELRNRLATLINALYGTSHGTVIPPAVAQALKVDESMSGFTRLADGSLKATDHPLTDRRLVAIMTAINLDSQGIGAPYAQLQRDIESVFHGARSPAFDQFAPVVRETVDALLQTLHAASEKTVSARTLKSFLPSLTSDLNLLKDQFADMEKLLEAGEREELRTLVNHAVELGQVFGTRVAKLAGAPAVPVPPGLVRPDVNNVEALIRSIPDELSPAEILAANKTLVTSRLSEAVGEAVRALGLDLAALIAFSPEDEEALKQSGDAAKARVEQKVATITAAVNRLRTAELAPAARTELVRAAIVHDGAIDEGALKTALEAYRTEQYKALAAERKASFEQDVADLVFKAINQVGDAGKKKYAAGLANLAKDFPQLKDFSKLVKQNCKDGALKLYDFTKVETVKSLLANKLTAEKAVFDTVDITKDLATFKASLGEAAERAAAKLAARFERVLTATVFEDDRTRLAELALDATQAEAFEAAFAKALKRYDESVFDRMLQEHMTAKVEIAQQKAQSAEASDPTISRAYRELSHFGFDPSIKEPKRRTLTENVWVRPQAKDTNDLLPGQVASDGGAALRASVRNLFADLFTAKGKDAASLKKLLLDNAGTLQTMILDPALVETTAVPGDAKGGDQLRVLFRAFLEAAKPGVNLGQLTPKDFKKALATVLEGPAFTTFQAGLAEAGRQVLAHLQQRLTESLTNVLRNLTSGGKNLALADKTLAELGASGLGSFDEGYGKFLANVLDHYFTDPTLTADHDRMLESLLRNGRTGGTIGEALGALIKGAGPIFQKVLQAIPTDGLPDEIAKALMDVKSGLAPIPEAVLLKRLEAAVAANNADPSREKILGIKLGKTLGAASVGQAVLCTVQLPPAKGNKFPRTEDVVIKFLRPGITEIATREQAFFRKMAQQVDESMVKSFGTRMDGIMKELDFRNEAKWVVEGACYGNPDNYGEAAGIKKGDDLTFESMGLSSALAPAEDLLALKVADGQPLDRANREVRQDLDRLANHLAKKVDDPQRGTVTVYEAETGYDLIEARVELAKMYERMEKERALLGELLKRFSAELFARNFRGEQGKDVGGFMHGDLHAGNLLVKGGKMTVIDFGNSFKFTGDERKLLVKFVAACGFSMGGVALEAVGVSSKHPQYKALCDGVNAILAKGDANDIVSRGMAVVQYLQQQKIEVPGPIVNFTETVMRLSAAYDETNQLMEDIAGVVQELKISPDAGHNPLDPFAREADRIFKASYRKDPIKCGALLNEIKPAIKELDRLARHSEELTPEKMERTVKPFLLLFRNCLVPYPDDHGVMHPVGEEFRVIAQKLELLGDGLYKGDPRAAELLAEIAAIVTSIGSELTSALNYSTEIQPQAAEGVNVCMSAGVNQLKKEDLVGIVGLGNAGVMWYNKGQVGAKVVRGIQIHEIANDARRLYQQRVGVIDLATRRFVDRQVRDHFIWSQGNPEEMFANAKWARRPVDVAAVKHVLKLNLDKLRARLAEAHVAGGETVENDALIPFALRHGLVQALRALDAKAFADLLQAVADPDLGAKLKFLREDLSLTLALQIGRCTETAMKNTVRLTTLQVAATWAENHFKTLGSPAALKGPALANMVELLKAQLAALQQAVDGEENLDDKDRFYSVQYAFLRHLLREGVLQQLNALSETERKALVSAVKSLDKKVGALLDKLVAYLK